MDTRLAILSRRDVKTYDGRAVDLESRARILDAGRLAGSAMNRQPWRFVVVSSPGTRDALAATVFAPANVTRAGLVVAIVVAGKGPVGFDAGRAAQNMMLAAWNEGIGSTPNGIADRDAASRILGVGEDETLQVVLSFGRPASPREPGARTPAEWSASANRRPLEELVSEL